MTTTVENVLAQVTSQLPIRLWGDSRSLVAGDIFVAMPGRHHDGRDHISQAIARGAAAVIWEAEGFAWPAQWQLPQVGVQGLNALAGELAHVAAGCPSEHMKVVAVTGTNGKTTVTHWLAQALSRSGKSCGVIGTLGWGLPDSLHKTDLTTPDALTLQDCLRQLQQQGAEYVAMEASSIALDQNRLAGLHPTVAAWTNLTRDHLDYHGTMDHYARSKRRLFALPGVKTAVVSLDDETGRELGRSLRQRNVDVLGIAIEPANAPTDIPLWSAEAGQKAAVRLTGPRATLTVTRAAIGRGNLQNLLMVTAILDALQVTPTTALLDQLVPPEGRMMCFGGGTQPLVVVDYAHTPDALSQALAAVREQCTGDLWCVFGCGGDRDPGKRPQMGALADALADVIVLTSDNPRSEDPEKILDDIQQAVPRARRITDRATAIAVAIGAAVVGDVILVAGKGHEQGQIIGRHTLPFSDADHVARALQARQSSC